MSLIGKRVKLIVALAPSELPIGTIGTVDKETIGMCCVQWDNGYYIPMYRHEFEVVGGQCEF